MVMMASQLRGAGQALGLTNPPPNSQDTASQVNGTDGTKRKLELKNRAGESKSPYVKAHGEDPVKWQIWGGEAIEMAKRENRLLFVSIGYNACHCKSHFLDWKREGVYYKEEDGIGEREYKRN